MNVDLTPLTRAVEPLWKTLKQLFSEHHFLTILCGFFVVMLTLSFYRFLRSINSALVALIFLVVVFILMLHWTQTRTEPEFLKPAIDWLVPYLPTSPYVTKK